ncbi:hypothetical protein X943_001181 [Babesia divergens]|uniref:Transcription factor CBF/NF-Y/archaeal histone domain-containing protein n=1 Tax=Babesia divergens TaxID=32595 RepID=A0AAD9LJC5_BABDI|nr:hypothetical protein X943_001181 [Babesia divergens]
MEGSGIDPKDLEILPVRLVQAALQKGLISQGVTNDTKSSDTASNSKQAAKYSPKNRRFSRDAINTLNRAASLFVLYIVSIAQDHARSKKRATVYDKDIREALKQGLFWEIEREMSEEMLNLYEEMKNKEVELNGGDRTGANLENGGHENTEDTSAQEAVDDNVDVDNPEEDYDESMAEIDMEHDLDGEIEGYLYDGPTDSHLQNLDSTRDQDTSEAMDHIGDTETMADEDMTTVPDSVGHIDHLQMATDVGSAEAANGEQSQRIPIDNQQNINTQYS